MRVSVQSDREGEQQILWLLKAGGTPENLAACPYLLDQLPPEVAGMHRHAPASALRAMLEEILDPTTADRHLMAAREYLGWVEHPYEQVIDSVKPAELAEVSHLPTQASDTDRRQHRDLVMSHLGVRDVWASRRLNPPNGLTVRQMRQERRRPIARSVLRALGAFRGNPRRVAAWVGRLTSELNSEFAPQSSGVPISSPSERENSSLETVKTDFTTIDSETHVTIGPNGQRILKLSRRIRADRDGLEGFEEFFSGSGDPDIQYHAIAEYGCRIRTQSSNHEGRLHVEFKLSRALSAGEIRTVRYIIERVDPDNDRPEPKNWFLTAYTEVTPTLYERVLISFVGHPAPTRVWRQITSIASRIPDDWNPAQELSVDELGDVEWELSDMNSNVHYVICWEYAAGPPEVG